MDGSPEQTPLSEALQVAHDAEQLSGALHNLGADVDADKARVCWAQCAMSYHKARCDVRKHESTAALESLRSSREGFQALIVLVTQAFPDGNPWLERATATLEILDAKLVALSS